MLLKKNDLTSEMQNQVKKHFSLQKIKQQKVTFPSILAAGKKGGPIQEMGRDIGQRLRLR